MEVLSCLPRDPNERILVVERDRPVLSCWATSGLVSDYLQSFHNWSIV